MTATPTAATPMPTPEELAAQTAASLFDGTIITESRLRDAIAAAIRQHSEGLRAENERLERIIAARDRQLTEETALSSRFATDLLAASSRATTADAALAKVTAERDEAQAETETIKQNAADAFTLIDYIADKIGLPDDQELGEVAFALWLHASQERERLMREAAVKLASAVAPLTPSAAALHHASEEWKRASRALTDFLSALQPQEAADER